MEVKSKRRNELLPAEIRLAAHAIAILIERIASMPKDVKDDLISVLLELRECETPEEVEEINETISEILYPESAGPILSGPFGRTGQSARLHRRAGFVAQTIREFRTERRWTQGQLASRSGLPQSHISRLERGQHSPSYATLEKLAKAFGIKVGKLDPSCD